MDAQENWNELRKKIEGLTDGLGMKIDRGIKEMVVALQAHGFQTSMSCEGHRDRACSYPWVWLNPKPNEKIGPEEERMTALLNEFYEDRDYPADARLSIFIMNGSFRLQAKGGKTLDELPREILTPRIRAKILKRYRKEMDDLQAFLKNKFFDSC